MVTIMSACVICSTDYLRTVSRKVIKEMAEINKSKNVKSGFGVFRQFDVLRGPARCVVGKILEIYTTGVKFDAPIIEQAVIRLGPNYSPKRKS